MVNLVHLKRNRPRYFHVGTDDAFRPIHFADRIDVRHEIATARKRTTRQFHLEFLFRSSYPNAIILANRFEQVDALVTEPVSGVSLRIRQGSVLVVQSTNVGDLGEVHTGSGSYGCRQLEKNSHATDH